MTTPDPDDTKQLHDENDAELAENLSDQSPDDESLERSTESDETADEVGDGNDPVVDPLLKAQLQPQDDSEKPQPQATEEPKKPAENKQAESQKKPSKPDGSSSDKSKLADDKDLSVALEKLPDEDWSKLSHKAKSQFLTQQKIVRSSQAAVQAAREEVKTAKADYDEVEKFRAAIKLSEAEFITSARLGSAIKHQSKDVIPFLEATLANLRKSHGIEEPQTTVETGPQIDVDELAALVDGARNYDLDAIGKLDQLVGRLKSGAKPKTAEKAPAQPAQSAKADQQQSSPAQPDPGSPEQQEYAHIIDALIGVGVPEEQVIEHVKELVADIVKAGDPGVGKRLAAVMRAHHGKVQKTVTTTPRVAAKPPLSGRGTVAKRVVADPNQPKDPLKTAFRR